jgi:indolepyruvate ferredoxin oxidoreductase, beta subunit
LVHWCGAPTTIDERFVVKSDGPSQTLCILIAALGGEGGGTLMNWIVDCAIDVGLPVQATSVPGVAQRTGSTSYYIEIGKAGGAQPVFALVPMQGRVDVVVASELAEAARILERGYISPERTTLITATSRVLTTAEKMQMGDGRFEDARILEAGKALAKRFIPLDLSEMAISAGTVISAPMFGALAGSGVLPWSREQSESKLAEGRGKDASLRGFAAAYAAASGETQSQPIVPLAPPDVAALGFARCVDYQDAAYGRLFESRVELLVSACVQNSPLHQPAVEEATRRLALWMTYEDIPRVAGLKIRPERFERIAKEAELSGNQLLKVTDLFKPGIEEIAAMLPVSLGERVMAHHRSGGTLPFLGKGRYLQSTAMSGNILLRMMAFMSRFRRSSLRFRDEQVAIEEWLKAMIIALNVAPDFAGALAELPRLLKGYGDTQARGFANYRAIFDSLISPALKRGVTSTDAQNLRKAVAAALADPEGVALQSTLHPFLIQGASA